MYSLGDMVRHNVSGRIGKVTGYVNNNWYEIELSPGVTEKWHVDRFDPAPQGMRDDGAVRLVYCRKCHCMYSDFCPKASSEPGHITDGRAMA